MWKPWFCRSRDPSDFIFRSAPYQRITPLATRSHSVQGFTSTDGAEYFDRNVPPSKLRLLSESVSYFKRPFNTLRMLTYRSESLFSTKIDCAIILTSFDTLNSPIQRDRTTIDKDAGCVERCVVRIVVVPRNESISKRNRAHTLINLGWDARGLSPILPQHDTTRGCGVTGLDQII